MALLGVLIDSRIYGGFGGTCRACVDPGSCVQWCMVKAADPRCPAGVPGTSWLECGLTLRDSHQPCIPQFGRRQRGSSVLAELDKAPSSPWLTVDYWSACRKMRFQICPKQIKWKQVSVVTWMSVAFFRCSVQIVCCFCQRRKLQCKRKLLYLSGEETSGLPKHLKYNAVSCIQSYLLC